MKVEEAILRIKNHIEIHSRQEKPFAVHITKALIMAVEALKKQIPKKPIVPWDSIDKTPICPSCQFGVMATQKYCDECGQALDWSETEKGGVDNE